MLRRRRLRPPAAAPRGLQLGLVMVGYFGLVLRLGSGSGSGLGVRSLGCMYSRWCASPVEPAGLCSYGRNPPSQNRTRLLCPPRRADLSDWLAGRDRVFRWTRAARVHRKPGPAGIDDARGEGPSRPRIVVSLSWSSSSSPANRPRSLIGSALGWLGPASMMSITEGLRRRAPPAGRRQLLRGLTVRYGRRRSLRYGLLVRVVAVSAPAGAIRWDQPRSCRRAERWRLGKPQGTQRPAEILEDLSISSAPRRSPRLPVPLLALISLLPLEELDDWPQLRASWQRSRPPGRLCKEISSGWYLI